MKRKEGFPGQLSYVIPKNILMKLMEQPLYHDLHITDIGYYPHALYHFRERPKGIDQLILIYTIEGQGYVEISGKGHKLSPQHFIMIPPHSPHTYYADKQNPWSIYWIHVGGEKAKYFAAPVSQALPVERSPTSRINERIALFDELFKCLEMGYGIEILEYVNLCLPRLLATFTHIQQYVSLNESITHDPVSQAINFMLDNLKNKRTLKALADEVNLSASYFSRLFLSRTGFPPMEYFNQLKIQHSCRLLDSKNLSVADVAREIGFEDPFYFSRLFRKVMNQSPRDYRKDRGMPLK
ncbi:MAG TPA: AraC family transcriptional regulator [Prolixibacteraceae bacterium]|nr:AraC family transcriptional regulator [Prolixibacteraceae bacterium]